MKRVILIVVAVLAVYAGGVGTALSAPLAYPVLVEEAWPVPQPPSPTAPSWLLFDDGAGAVIASRSADTERSIASVTKIMTGLLVLERGHLDDEVVISGSAAATGEKEIDLVAGETVTVEALFKALMVHSANDAATALAEHIGGSVSGFVDMMNQRAAELGLEHTHFANPHGLDAPGHYSTANDLLVIARKAMEYPIFADAVRSTALVFPAAPDGSLRRGSSTNLMLDDYDGMIGVKTGFTFQALLTFVGAAERDGRRIYVILLGSEGQRGHFADARLLLDYAFDEMPYYRMVSTGNPYIPIQPRPEPGPLTVERDIEAFLHLAGQGIFSTPPAPANGEPIPEPSPVVETVVEPKLGPGSFWESITFWFSRNGDTE